MSSSSRSRFPSLTVAMRSITSPASKVGSGVCERVGGFCWRLPLDEREVVGIDAEPFEVSSGKVEVDLVSARLDLGDLKYCSGSAFSGDLVA